jgi:cystathionine beta-lyase/cystathionine gamma-synthase
VFINPESLVLPPALQQPRGLQPAEAAWTGIGPGTVRLSVGIEDAEDLIADLRQALERSGS